MRVTCIRDWRTLERLAVVWNRLLRRSSSDCIFLTWEWIATWIQVFGARYRPLVLVAHEPTGRLVGIAPLMVSAGGSGVRARFRQLSFISQSEDVTAEYLDFIIAAGWEEPVLQAFWDQLLGQLRGEWDHLLFERMLTTSPNLPLLVDRLELGGVAASSAQHAVSPFAALPLSWDEYLGERSKHFRKRVRYRERRLASHGEVRLEQAGHGVSLERAFEALMTLNSRRWGEQGESFRSPGYIAFHRLLSGRLLRRGWLALSQLRVGQRVVACEYNFAYGGKVWGNQGGWLPEWRELGVASVLTARVIRWSIEQGFREYDLLAGESAYKWRWATDERHVIDLEAHNATLRGQAFRVARRGRRALRETGEYAIRYARNGLVSRQVVQEGGA